VSYGQMYRFQLSIQTPSYFYFPLAMAQATALSLALAFVPDPWGNNIQFCM